MILIIPKMAKSTTLPYKIPIREKTGLGAETGERGIIFFYYLLDYKKPVPPGPHNTCHHTLPEHTLSNPCYHSLPARWVFQKKLYTFVSTVHICKQQGMRKGTGRVPVPYTISI